MGFYHIWKKASAPPVLGRVATTVLGKSLGDWHSGYTRKNPEVHVEVISQIVRPVRGFSRPPHWFRRVRGWLGLL